jgi:methylenetetrahydrofolate reductase (NADPH)
VSDALALRVRELAAAASVEVTPRDARRLVEVEPLPPGTSVYITALPGHDPDETVRAAVAVRVAGHAPVPHIAARTIADSAALDRFLGNLVAEAGVDDVLVVAGSAKRPAGVLASSLDVLRSGLLERHGIARVGVAGHPEGSPDFAESTAVEALLEKNAIALDASYEVRVVTQFALVGAPYVSWERGVREAGNRLPVVAGVPGVTSPATLLKYGLACGIGASLDVLRKKSGGLLRLATSRVWTPDALVAEIAAATLEDPNSLYRGLHLFPFGGIDRTAAWLAEVRDTPTALRA